MAEATGATAETALPEGQEAPDGRATRWSGQQERRRAEFVAAAMRAIATHGPEVSTEQIAAEAGVARTRLYRHFAGATELNQAIAARAEEMILERLTPVWDVTHSPATIITSAVATHLEWLTEHEQLYRYLLRHSVTTASGETVVNDVRRLIADLLVRLLEHYVVALGLDVRTVQPLAFGLVGFVDAAAGRWVIDPGEVSLPEMVDLLGRWIWSVVDTVLRGEGVTLDPDVPLAPTQP